MGDSSDDALFNLLEQTPLAELIDIARRLQRRPLSGFSLEAYNATIERAVKNVS